MARSADSSAVTGRGTGKTPTCLAANGFCRDAGGACELPNHQGRS